MHLNAAVLKAALAARPSTPTWILEGLAGDEDRVVRYLLAGNPAAPVAVLARLSHDACPSVRAEVAANPSTLSARGRGRGGAAGGGVLSEK